eukprot:9042343-Alexandrium_andersonii.AAC.1
MQHWAYSIARGDGGWDRTKVAPAASNLKVAVASGSGAGWQGGGWQHRLRLRLWHVAISRCKSMPKRT